MRLAGARPDSRRHASESQRKSIFRIMMDQEPGLACLRLQRLDRDRQRLGGEALRQFWVEVEQQGAPIIEPATEGYVAVTFLWRDDGPPVRLP